MKKQISKNISLIILFLSFLFSCQKRSNLEHALELAGKNRIELEKVLEHYSKKPENRLKLEATRFLIENMDTYFSYSSQELEPYYQTLDSIFTLNDRQNDITQEQKILLAKLTKPNPFYYKSIPDLQRVSADFLIDNIDRAFEAWTSPFAKELSFDDFCEFLLPYKVNLTDYPDFWRSDYYNSTYPYVKFQTS